MVHALQLTFPCCSSLSKLLVSNPSNGARACLCASYRFCTCCAPCGGLAVCENSLDFTLGKLRTNLDLMEQYHQGVYLGFGGLHKPAGEVYSIWTKPKLEYDVSGWAWGSTPGALPAGLGGRCWRCWQRGTTLPVLWHTVCLLRKAELLLHNLFAPVVFRAWQCAYLS